MSYCRWSSGTEDGHKSDVYVYEAEEGYVIHVAAFTINNRSDDPYPVFSFDISSKNVFETYRIYMDDLVKWKERNQVNKSNENEYLGKSWGVSSIGECVCVLNMLKQNNLHVPQYAVDNLLLDKEWEDQNGR